MKPHLRKILLCILFTATAIALLPGHAFAHSGSEHNQELERVLFGDNGVQYANAHKNANGKEGDAEGKAIYALEDAAYLCIDQYGRRDEKGENCIAYLRRYVGVGIPQRLHQINPAATGPLHRSYTHQGWDHGYSQNSENGQTLDAREHPEKWAARKTILLNTADRVFSFTPLSMGWLVGHSEKCDSFCALIYYTHVLGDYLEDKTYTQFFEGSNGLKIPFAVPNPSDENPDIFWEIDKHLAVLFGENGGTLYRSLDQQLDTLANRARRLAGAKSGLTQEEAYAQGHEYAEELMALLTGYDNPSYSKSYGDATRIHMLLMREDWFTSAFPSH